MAEKQSTLAQLLEGVIGPATFWGRQMHLREEIKTIRRYFETVPPLLAEQEKKHFADLQNLPAMSDDEMEWHHANYSEISDLYLNRFPQFMLETAFVASYALLEHEMMGVCRQLGKFLKIELGPEELKDKGITAARKYLKKLCGIEVPEGSSWTLALRHGDIRNVFAHAGGRVKEDNKKVRKYVAVNKDKLSFGVLGNRLLIKMPFCIDVLENIEKLMAGVYEVGIKRIKAENEKEKK